MMSPRIYRGWQNIKGIEQRRDGKMLKDDRNDPEVPLEVKGS